jgi:hypothetical protein
MYPYAMTRDHSGYGSIQRLAVHQTLPYVQYNLGNSLSFNGDVKLSSHSHRPRM